MFHRYLDLHTGAVFLGLTFSIVAQHSRCMIRKHVAYLGNQGKSARH